MSLKWIITPSAGVRTENFLFFILGIKMVTGLQKCHFISTPIPNF